MPRQKTKTHYRVKRKIKSNRRWHQRLILHPASLFVLLCVGVILLTSSLQAASLTYRVTAKVPAPPLPSPAIIQIATPVVTASGNKNDTDNHQAQVNQATSPQTAIHVGEKSITLSGDCPTTSHIEVYRNDIFVGATDCIGDPTFSIQVDLVPGLNKILARVFNITEDEGPVSQAIYINYDLPANAFPASVQPFLMSSDFQYLGFLSGHKDSWNVFFTGGAAPYHFMVFWGDGTTTNYTATAAGTLVISHTYQKASGIGGYHINIESSDGSGQAAILQLMSIISQPSSYQAAQIALANENRHPPFLSQVRHWLWLEWPLYGVIVLMAASYLLGEREEYKHLMSRRLRHRHA